MRILFVAPTNALNAMTELSRIASGHQFDICDGAVDRAKLERYLVGDIQYDVVHFGQHGNVGILDYHDGPLDKSELVAMLRGQRSLKFIVINACNSIAMAVDIHNALQLPVVAMNASITDISAVRFAESLYRNLRSGMNLHVSVEAARAVLARLYPDQASVPQLINGNKEKTDELLNRLDIGYNQIRFEIVEIGSRLGKVEEAQSNFMTHLSTTDRAFMWAGVSWQIWAIMAICLLTSVLAFLVLVRVGNAG